MNKETLYSEFHQNYDQLKTTLQKGINEKEIIKYTLDTHALVHPKEISQLSDDTLCDYVLNYMLQDNNKEIQVPRMDGDINLDYAGSAMVPLCWQFWHIYRIEDLVTNYLIADQEQIFNETWKSKINSPITDTGNALTPKQAIDFGKCIDVLSLKEYMLKVSTNTREIISNLTLEKINEKATKTQLEKILTVGGITTDSRSIWLNDFWGSLTIGGMILTPLTDHHMMHLPPCIEHLSLLS